MEGFFVNINSYVLRAHNTQNKLKRHQFNKEIGLMLSEDAQKRRSQNWRIARDIRTKITKRFPEETDMRTSRSLTSSVKRCEFCDGKKDRKV